MTSYELPYGLSSKRLEEDVESRAILLAEEFQVTGVYGRHLSTEDVARTLSAITDGSLVFVEGYLKDIEYAHSRLAQHAKLADARLEAGSYDGLDELCEQLSSEFIYRHHSPETDHDEYSYVLYRGLFSKNCVVLPADFMNLDDTIQLSDTQELEDKIVAEIEQLSFDNFSEIVRLEEQASLAWLERQQLREMTAVRAVLFFSKHFLQEEQLDSVTQALNKKRLIYFVYGLAHRNSLTARFAALGIPVNTTRLDIEGQSTEEQLDLAERFAITPEQQKQAIINHYLGQLVSQQNTEE